MITPNDYQKRVLASLKTFLHRCARDGRPDTAFREAQLKQGLMPIPYLPIASSGLHPDLPYVCLRVPTGGGKTLLACHTVGLAIHEYLETDHAVVLWLVPSHTILSQTADALRDPQHPYRRALDLTGGPVDVVTIEEALRLPQSSVDGQTLVIVATIQAFRVEDTTGRKVYEENGILADHFTSIPSNRLPDLLLGTNKLPVPSLVNLLRLHRPIIIVDEAHNARTDLSFATLGAILPSCIIEFTATPARSGTPSNVLHHVSAAELKAENMVKLPVRVMTRHPSQREQLLTDALTLRTDLERLAIAEGQQTGEYLRPILLIQAERVDDCEPLRDRLAADFQIPRDTIKISVGKLDELKAITNIRDPECPVRYILTVEKLREGWDCPFAYVLCSLKETRSATAIEQLVGRILRLPNTRVKRHSELNWAYAFSVSPSIGEVLAELRDALESNGFTQAEAQRIILPIVQPSLALGARPYTMTLTPGTDIDTKRAQVQIAQLNGKVELNPATGDLTLHVPLDEQETDILSTCLLTQSAKTQVQALVTVMRETEQAFGGTGHTRTPSPYEQNRDFPVPLLCVNENGRLFEFESTFLLEHPWKLSTKDATLSDQYNPLVRPTGKAGLVDIGHKGEVQTSILPDKPGSDFIRTLHEQVQAFGGADPLSLDELIAWLDRHIDHQDIPTGESAAFLQKAIRGLMTRTGITDISLLALDRYRLRDEIEARIQAHRNAERQAAFQQYLLPESSLAVSQEHTVNFRTMAYEPSWLYEGSFQFAKHYFGQRPGELREQTKDGSPTEEFQCAQVLDQLPEVAYWVRNLAGKPNSFRLQTSKNLFYPDFICRLTDGRTVVVEYKGAHLVTDAEEKRLVGTLWASRSQGQCLFVMPSDKNWDAITGCIRKTS